MPVLKAVCDKANHNCQFSILHSHFKRPSFAFRKATFYRLKGRLLQCERRPFANPLIVSRLRVGS